MSRENSNQLVTDCRNFFWSLVDKSDTYFLSDCVEEIKDYVGEEAAKELCNKRDELLARCKENAINFHSISCDVCNEFLHNKRGGMTTTEVCDELFGISEWIQGMLSSSELEDDNVKSMLFAIDEAVNLIKTHVINDDDNQLTHEEREQDHIKRMQFAIDEAVNLIRTHIINDDDNQLPPPPSEIHLVI